MLVIPYPVERAPWMRQGLDWSGRCTETGIQVLGFYAAQPLHGKNSWSEIGQDSRVILPIQGLFRSNLTSAFRLT